jgi:hypothetical protein
MIEKIEVVKRSKVSKSKLYHIRATALKQISKRMKMMFVNIKEDMTLGKEEIKPEEIVDEVIEAVENASEEVTETPVEEVK